ncbi:hypothetical protein [Amycolatopsis sp. H20-H5]|uniref:hypothetical protein n=1 Tax=Amycolatopsis sp. H20-H5 TaxID=3046309 RepID=UPI002DBDAEC6|nr:hypothetical protein [Amycolatopsis sp. H20-H5]MEC3981988.1 hypothetical protein [Amycolatopsis sp. H20-H5]
MLARLDPWIQAGIAVAPVHLVVTGARKWPPAVAGAAGHRVQQLMADATFLPHDADIAAHGITAAVTPKRLRASVTAALRRTGALTAPCSPPDTRADRGRATRSTGGIDGPPPDAAT